MTASSQSVIFTNVTYVDEIKKQIVLSGGTVIHIKNNIIVASEISEAEYRELLKNPYIDKLDVLPLKRYGNEGITYQKSDYLSEIQSDTLQTIFKI